MELAMDFVSGFAVGTLGTALVAALVRLPKHIMTPDDVIRAIRRASLDEGTPDAELLDS
jgi:hypothetical protein